MLRLSPQVTTYVLSMAIYIREYVQINLAYLVSV